MKYLALFLLMLLTAAQKDNKRDKKLATEQSHATCNPHNNTGCEKFFMREYPSPLQPNHKCTDFVQQKRDDSNGLINLLTSDFEKDFNLWRRKNRLLQSLYYIKNQITGQEFLICSIPKTGVTRVKVLLMRVAGIKGGVHKQSNWKFLPLLQHDEKLRLLTNKNVLRIRLVRNPYIRALSMYFDKVVQHSKLIELWGFESFPPSFDDWVAKYFERKNSGYFFDTHYSPQFEHCWGNFGFKFDYVLKIERQNFWYPCLVEKLNLWNFVMRGWDDEDHCYFSTPTVPCNGPVQNLDGRITYPSKGEMEFPNIIIQILKTNLCNCIKINRLSRRLRRFFQMTLFSSIILL
eukprot:TRINITY_DN1222_c0_g3_i1.p1 TRINITY_DN1222_c0_g3~~TRINITY_DN1222_c0_g3_i1.p1  ORF type:complete len:347 (-),score=38.32 TRINITY_DN1222_c0_g3_i1:351-1391(-)